MGSTLGSGSHRPSRACVRPGCGILTSTAVIARSGELVYAHGIEHGQTAAVSLRIEARRVVMATGAVERPIAFVDNDRPGVMLLGAAERLLARYGARVGQRVVLFGNHDRLYASATRLRAGRHAGSPPIVDVRPAESIAERKQHRCVRLWQPTASSASRITPWYGADGRPAVRARRARNARRDHRRQSGHGTPHPLRRHPDERRLDTDGSANRGARHRCDESCAVDR